MSDFMIWLEENGFIRSTEWAFDNLSEAELDNLCETQMDNYLRSIGR